MQAGQDRAGQGRAGQAIVREGKVWASGRWSLGLWYNRLYVRLKAQSSNKKERVANEKEHRRGMHAQRIHAGRQADRQIEPDVNQSQLLFTAVKL